MLNLSDKELDRFSREAAQEYEPGEVLGPRNWERLEVRLDTEFGRSGWNFWRHVRRYPIYYAPALVVLMGISYFLVRPGSSSGSSPGKTAKMPTEKTTNNQNPTSTHSLTSTPDATTRILPAVPDGQDAARAGGPAASGAASGGASDANAATGGAGNPVGSAGAGVKGSAGANEPAGANGAAGAAGANGDVAKGAAGAGVNAAGAGVRPAGSNAGATGMNAAGAGMNVTGKRGNGSLLSGNNANRERNVNGGSGVSGHHGKDRTGHHPGKDSNETNRQDNTLVVTSGAGSGNGASAANKPGAGNGSTGSPTNTQRELSLSTVQTAHSLGRRGRIGDSALRAFTLKSTPALKPSRHLEIRRNWQFGLSIAPDFTSVNSLSSDKPGSSFGLTVDYMFAPHWYISSAILATRKNYAARNDNYAPPQNFYQRNNVMGDKINFAKGSFYMMEIPLNLRYDFSVSGNTLFFISGGTSTYLLTKEDVNLYYQRFGFLWCQPVPHPASKSTYLFSTINLSAGVETGLSNSMSLLVAPYVKLPTTKMGIGQVDMNSVGITFALKFAPVTGYKRK